VENGEREREGEGEEGTGAVAIKDRIEGVSLVQVGLVGYAQLVLLVIPVALSAGVSSIMSCRA
jgi:hypothetical protein